MQKIAELKSKADRSLAVIAGMRRELAAVQEEAEAALARIREAYGPAIQVWEEEIAEVESELIGLMKANKGVLFDGIDQVDLEHGILLYGKESRISIPKTAVAVIEAQGWEEGLKRTVAVDREVVAKWPVERLAVIGATRKEKETYSYEVKETEKV